MAAFGGGLGWVDLHQNQAALDRYPLGSWSNALMEERWAWTRSAGSRSSSISGDMVWTLSTPENRDVPVVLIYHGEATSQQTWFSANWAANSAGRSLRSRTVAKNVHRG